MFTIETSEQFRTLLPDFRGAAIVADVTNPSTSPRLWEEVERAAGLLRSRYDTTSIKARPTIAATRQAYKAAGKDPSRYRPACEQLARRVLQGKELYSIDTLVDVGNLVSLYSGYSTAALDADHICGERIMLDFGRVDDNYEGIGRGLLNIEHLPAYRDAVGAFATPTSDSTRTMVSAATHHLLLLINGYDGDAAAIDDAVGLTRRLLEEYADGKVHTVLYY